MSKDAIEDKVRQILDRLIEARKAAGLSQTQAAKLLGYTAASTLSQIEGDFRDTEPKISMLLKMCEVYDVSIIWVLTGTNPDFDESAFDDLTQFSNAALKDIANLKDTLKRLSYGGNND